MYSSQEVVLRTAPGTMDVINRVLKKLPELEAKTGKVEYLFCGLSGINREQGKITQIRAAVYVVETKQLVDAQVGNPKTTMEEESISDLITPLRIMPMNGTLLLRHPVTQPYGNAFKASPNKDLVTWTIAAKLEGQSPYALLQASETDIFGKIVYRAGVYVGLGKFNGRCTEYDMKTMVLQVYPDKAKKFDAASLGLLVDEVYLFAGLKKTKSLSDDGKPVLSLGGFFEVMSAKAAVEKGRFTQKEIDEAMMKSDAVVPEATLQLKRPREEPVDYI